MAIQWDIKVKRQFKLEDILPEAQRVLSLLVGEEVPSGRLVFRHPPEPQPGGGWDLDQLDEAPVLTREELAQEWTRIPDAFTILTDSRSRSAVDLLLFEITAADLGVDGLDSSPEDRQAIGTWCSATPWRTTESIVLAIASAIAVAFVSNSVVVDDSLKLTGEHIMEPEALLARLALTANDAAGSPERAVLAKTGIRWDG